jgi:uncharacterized protein (TIGR02246 family)
MQISILVRSAIAFVVFALGSAALAQSEVQALADKWAQAYNTHNRAALGALYTEDARVMATGSPSTIGRSNIEAFWARDFQDRNPLTLLKVTHSIQGSDMTLVHGDYQVINRDTGGQLSSGRFVHLWTKSKDGSWKLDRDIWSGPFEPYVSEQRTDSEIQKLADRWTAAYNKHDRAALEALYTDNARLMMHGAPTIAGRKEIGTFWGEDFKAGHPLTLLTVTHALEGIDMTIVHGNYQVIDRNDGSVLGSGRFAHIWTSDRNAGWRLDRDLWLERSTPAE